MKSTFDWLLLRFLFREGFAGSEWSTFAFLFTGSSLAIASDAEHSVARASLTGVVSVATELAEWRFLFLFFDACCSALAKYQNKRLKVFSSTLIISLISFFVWLNSLSWAATNYRQKQRIHVYWYWLQCERKVFLKFKKICKSVSNLFIGTHLLSFYCSKAMQEGL